MGQALGKLARLSLLLLLLGLACLSLAAGSLQDQASAPFKTSFFASSDVAVRRRSGALLAPLETPGAETGAGELDGHQDAEGLALQASGAGARAAPESAPQVGASPDEQDASHEFTLVHHDNQEPGAPGAHLAGAQSGQLSVPSAGAHAEGEQLAGDLLAVASSSAASEPTEAPRSGGATEAQSEAPSPSPSSVSELAGAALNASAPAQSPQATTPSQEVAASTISASNAAPTTTSSTTTTTAPDAPIISTTMTTTTTTTTTSTTTTTPAPTPAPVTTTTTSAPPTSTTSSPPPTTTSLPSTSPAPTPTSTAMSTTTTDAPSSTTPPAATTTSAGSGSGNSTVTTQAPPGLATDTNEPTAGRLSAAVVAAEREAKSHRAGCRLGEPGCGFLVATVPAELPASTAANASAASGNNTRQVSEFVILPEPETAPLTFEESAFATLAAAMVDSSSLKAEHRDLDGDSRAPSDGPDELELDYVDASGGEAARAASSSTPPSPLARAPSTTSTTTSRPATGTQISAEVTTKPPQVAAKASTTWTPSTTTTTTAAPVTTTTSTSTSSEPTRVIGQSSAFSVRVSSSQSGQRARLQMNAQRLLRPVAATNPPAPLETTTTTTTMAPPPRATAPARPPTRRPSAHSAHRQPPSARPSPHRQYFADPTRDSADWRRRRPAPSSSGAPFSGVRANSNYSPLANGADEEEASILTRYAIPSQLSRLSSVASPMANVPEQRVIRGQQMARQASAGPLFQRTSTSTTQAPPSTTTTVPSSTASTSTTSSTTTTTPAPPTTPPARAAQTPPTTTTTTTTTTTSTTTAAPSRVSSTQESEMDMLLRIVSLAAEGATGREPGRPSLAAASKGSAGNVYSSSSSRHPHASPATRQHSLAEQASSMAELEEALRSEIASSLGPSRTPAGHRGAHQPLAAFARATEAPLEQAAAANSVDVSGSLAGAAAEEASVLPGRPGVDYPLHWQVPRTSFDCRHFELSGFYADPESDCQAYHSCHRGRGGQHTFLCPNGTLFSQELLTCDWWYNVDCQGAAAASLAPGAGRRPLRA